MSLNVIDCRSSIVPLAAPVVLAVTPEKVAAYPVVDKAGLPDVVAIEAVRAVPRVNETLRVPIDAPVTAPAVVNG